MTEQGYSWRDAVFVRWDRVQPLVRGVGVFDVSPRRGLPGTVIVWRAGQGEASVSAVIWTDVRSFGLEQGPGERLALPTVEGWTNYLDQYRSIGGILAPVRAVPKVAIDFGTGAGGGAVYVRGQLEPRRGGGRCVRRRPRRRSHRRHRRGRVRRTSDLDESRPAREGILSVVRHDERFLRVHRGALEAASGEGVA